MQTWLPRRDSVAGRGCLPRGANILVAAPTPAIRSPVDILVVTTMALVWTVNSTLSWGCNYVMQWNFARSGQISEFHILRLQMPPPAQCRPGRIPLPLPPSRSHWRDYPPCKFWFYWYSGGFWTRRNITTLTFWTPRSRVQMESLNLFSRFMTQTRHVSALGGACWGLGRW